MIKVSVNGDFSKTGSWLAKLRQAKQTRILEKYGKEGVSLLKNATPKDTGLTADSWDYRITQTATSASVEWFNTNRQNGVLVAILLQYGHGTRNGGYVHGIDYINPAIQPVMNQMADEAWKEVSSV